MNAPTSLATLQQQGGALAPQKREDYSPGFSSAQSFELMIRQSKLLMTTTLVPSAYRAEIVKLDKYGNVKEARENPNALSNCAVALNMATRMGADPLMVMQNLYIVEGRPSWSSQWIIAAINGCGRFSPLRFEIKVLGDKTVPYSSTVWENGERRTKTEQVKITDKVCVAWVKELATGERLESPPVSIEMAVREGWYSKNGSKWQTMDEVMLRYRSASFFGKLYAPELLMGLQSTEEVYDFIDMEPTTQPTQAAPTPITELRAEPAAAAEKECASPVADTGTEQVDQATGEIQQHDQQESEAQPFDAANLLARMATVTSQEGLDILTDEVPADISQELAGQIQAAYEKRRAELQQPQAGARRARSASGSSIE